MYPGTAPPIDPVAEHERGHGREHGHATNKRRDASMSATTDLPDPASAATAEG
ncbi:hypothetical protein [Embleya sp. NPDC005575]|uniref:hypothetical protein n=1 Tax=Embleya sp. NPDC005575 TaxID=3156892 RepID=UPI0033A8D0C7